MQAVDGIGYGPAARRRGWIGGDAFPVGDHALGDRVAEESAIGCPQQRDGVVIQRLVGGIEHPVQLIARTGEEAVQRGAHVQVDLPHDGGPIRVAWPWWAAVAAAVTNAKHEPDQR